MPSGLGTVGMRDVGRCLPLIHFQPAIYPVELQDSGRKLHANTIVHVATSGIAAAKTDPGPAAWAQDKMTAHVELWEKTRRFQPCILLMAVLHLLKQGTASDSELCLKFLKAQDGFQCMLDP